AVALGQLRDLFDRQSERGGQRLDGLPAADVGAGGNVLDPVRLQHLDQPFGLLEALGTERPLLVRPGPALAVSSVRVADDENPQTVIQSRSLRLRAAFQAFGQAALAWAAADRSEASSSPATSAVRVPTRRDCSRSQRWASTASWCSPRMVWRRATAPAKSDARAVSGAAASAA